MTELERRLNYGFRDPSLLERALRHASCCATGEGGTDCNEILEFLGDAVLGLAVADWLVQNCLQRQEGELTQIRAQVVSQLSLAAVAKDLLLGEYLQLGRPERQAGVHLLPSVLAGAFEAVVGAIHMDGGYQEAARVALEQLLPRIEQIAFGAEQGEDFKSRLQVWAQATKRTLPTYLVIDEEGPDHSKWFSVEVSVDGERLGCGRGRSKKQAEQEAARQALAKIEAGEGT